MLAAPTAPASARSDTLNKKIIVFILNLVAICVMHLHKWVECQPYCCNAVFLCVAASQRYRGVTMASLHQALCSPGTHSAIVTCACLRRSRLLRGRCCRADFRQHPMPLLRPTEKSANPS